MRTSPFVVLAFLVVSCTDGGVSADGGATTDAPLLDAVTLDAPTVDAPAVDAPDLDAPGADAPAGPVLLGSSVVRQRVYAMAPSTGTMTTDAITTSDGSLLLASAARGTWDAAPDAPTDSFGNTFVVEEGPHDYGAWPGSRTALFASLDVIGGSNHTFSLTWGDIGGGSGDEVTLSVVEIAGGTDIEDVSWVERAGDTTITSAPVTTTGPALLVAWWWGSGTVRPAGESHVAVPGDGFTLVSGATALVSPSPNGYVQVAVAARAVSAGTYTISWATDGEGAQLYLAAVR